jgi:glycosyltransferase involved in cell wall biosynthesis
MLYKITHLRENPFWRTLNAITRIKLALARLVPSILEDLYADILKLLSLFKIHLDRTPTDVPVEIQNLKNPNSFSVNFSDSPNSKPVIFVSACESKYIPGGWKYNGGIKELNYLVKLLRGKGYEAYVVTYDGSFEPWLVEHQPHISLTEFRHKIQNISDFRCVTSWAAAKAFVQASPHLYLWDMEVAASDNRQYHILGSLYRKKIRNTASISRTVQAWHMAHFQRSCILLPNLLDDSLWFPLNLEKQSRRIGYMNEGKHTESYLEVIKNLVAEQNLELEFKEIKGCEADVLAGMRSCEVFLSMNIGKDKLWGEGCPRTVIEALSVGCVVIAFDIIGNRETIQPNFNSVLLPRYRPDLMAEALINIYKTSGELERLRTNSQNMMATCHTFEARWPAVKEFLHL